MKTRRAGKKPKRYIGGRVLPIISITIIAILFACLFLPLVSGSRPVNGMQAIGGLFDNPYNPLSIFGKRGAFYQEFIRGAELDPSLIYFADLYRFAATLVVPVLVIVLIIMLAIALKKAIFELKDGRVRAAIHLKFVAIFLVCLGIAAMLPGLQIEYMEEAEEFSSYFLRYLLFTHTYQFGIGLIICSFLSLGTAFLPFIIRAFVVVFTRRDVELE